MDKGEEIYRKKRIRIACVGDSLTDGYRSTGGNKSADSYPAQLSRLLGDGYEVKNFGKTSATLQKGTGCSYRDTDEFAESMAYDADIVLVILGTNDAKAENWNEEQYRADAIELVGRYKAVSGSPRIIFATTPYCYQRFGDDITTDSVEGKLNPVQRALIEEQKWETVDLFEKTRQRPELYFEDQVHLTDAGYRYIAECMYQALMGTGLCGSIVDSNVQYTKDRCHLVRAKSVNTAELTAWKNDIAVSEISLTSSGEACTNVRLSASDFVGNGGRIPKENIRLTFIKSVQAYNGMPGYGDTERPLPEGERYESNDVLDKDASEPIDIAADSIQNVWVSVRIPADAEAGTYVGTVTVDSDMQEKSLVFTYTLKVADARLADASEFKNGFDIELWQNPYRVAEYYGVEPFSGEHFAILKPHLELYKAVGGHAVTTTIVEEAWGGQTHGDEKVKFPSMVKWTRKTDGTWAFDYTCFDQWVEFNKKVIGIGDKIVCYSIAPWTNAVVFYDEKTDRMEEKPLEAGTAEWTGIWTAFLNDLADHLYGKGWFEQTYIGIDERGFHAAAFDLIDSIRRGIPHPSKLKSAGAMDHFVEKRDLAMRVDDLNVGSIAVKAHPAEFEEVRRARKLKRLRTTIYSCTGHIPGNFSLSAPGESYWTMMYSYSVGGEGYLRWAYDSWVSDPLRDTTHNAFEAGDCFLVYPDEKDSEKPITKSSVRLEKMAEGVRDVNKLIKIKEDIPRMGAAVDILLDKVKPAYASGDFYLTDEGKDALVKDMADVKEGIAALTDAYIAAKESGAAENDEGLYPYSRIPQYKLTEEYLLDIEKKPGTPRQYLGQPDLVRTETGRLITVYPIGHGHGAIVMQISDDNGETWTEKTDTPESWVDCQETPTLYSLKLDDGRERIMLLSACPGGWGNYTTGWDSSYSDDNGEMWTEYEHFYSEFTDGRKNNVIVGMASLIQLKDSNGNAVQKWMGVYHDWNYVNYKTYLTFDEAGRQQWSEPAAYLGEHRAVEEAYQLCEAGLFRSPDGKRIVGLARSQSHAHLSAMFYSDDEGETWSEPLEMQGSLAGERHKAAYDPISGRLLVTFREIIYGEKIDDSWMAGDWVAWVGTYEDLLEQREGEYRILLSEDWSQNAKSGDTGYAGIVVLEDGTFILDSYGHFDREFSENYAAGGSYDVKKDLCYIRQAKFKLREIERELRLPGCDIIQMFDNENDPGDTSWVFTGGQTVQGVFSQIGGARNYIGHIEEYARNEKTHGDDLTRQRYMINTARKGQTLSDIVESWERTVIPLLPKAVCYMICAEDYTQGEAGIPGFKDSLKKLIEGALALKPERGGFVCIQKPFAVRDASVNAEIERYCSAVDAAVSGYRADEAAYDHIFVLDHYALTKNNRTFLEDMQSADGELNAAGHLELGRQFAAAVMKKTDCYPCIQGVRMKQKAAAQPQVYLEIMPEVKMDGTALHVVIPEGYGTEWRYMLKLGETEISGTVNGSQFTVGDLAGNQSYVLKIQSADGFTQLTTVRGITAQGNRAVVNKQELNENQKRLADRMNRKERMTWLFMGDSITHGLVYTYGYGSTVQTFEKYLKETLKRPSDIVVNTGVSGATTASTLKNIGERLEKYTPDVAVLMFGTNDAAEIVNMTTDEFEENMRIIIGKIRRINPEASIVLRCPTPMTSGCEDALYRRPHAIENMERLKKLVAEDESLIYVDQYTAVNEALRSYGWLDRDEQIFLGNWLHPGINLHLVMAKQIIRACGLWTEDSPISNLYYETPILNETSAFMPELQLTEHGIGISIDGLRVDCGMQLGEVTVKAAEKDGTRCYKGTAEDGKSDLRLENLPYGAYRVEVSSYLKDEAKTITFAEQDIYMR